MYIKLLDTSNFTLSMFFFNMQNSLFVIYKIDLNIRINYVNKLWIKKF